MKKPMVVGVKKFKWPKKTRMTKKEMKEYLGKAWR